MPPLLTLEHIDSNDSDLVGQKLALLGQLNKLGINTKAGFVLSHHSFEKQIEEVWEKVRNLLPREFNNITPSLHDQILTFAVETFRPRDEVIKTLKEKRLVQDLSISVYFENPELKFYFQTQTYCKNLAELPGTFANLWLTLLHPNLKEKFSSLDQIAKTKVSFFISKDINPEISIKLFSANAGTYEIKSQWGFYTPHEGKDACLINRFTGELEKYQTEKQEKQLIRLKGILQLVPIATKFQEKKKLSPEIVETLFLLAKRVENYFLNDFEILFCIQNGKLYATEIEFNTFIEKIPNNTRLGINLPLLNKLAPGFSGIATGLPVKFNSKSLKQLSKGTIVFVDEIRKENLKLLNKASGIISKTRPPLEVLRGLAVPTVFGKESFGSKALTLDGGTGKVYLGSFSSQGQVLERKLPELKSETRTATKIFQLLESLEQIPTVSVKDSDGFAPVKSEKLIASLLTHPKELAKKKEGEKYLVDQIVAYLEKVGQASQGKSIIYQLTDFKSSDLLLLRNGQNHETSEANPILGLRGAKRHLLSKELLLLETAAVKIVRNKLLFKNISVSLPFVRTTKELSELKKILSAQGLPLSPSFKIFVSLSLPINLFQLEEFAQLNISGIIVNFNEIISLLYGEDFSQTELSYFKEDSFEVFFHDLVTRCKRLRLPVILSNFPEALSEKLLEVAVNNGVYGVSTSLDLNQTRKLTAKLENNLVNK